MMEVGPSNNFVSALLPQRNNNSCWKLRTRFEKVLLAILILVVALLIAIIFIIAIFAGKINHQGIQSFSSDNYLLHYNSENELSLNLLHNKRKSVCLSPECVKSGEFVI